MCGSLWPMSQVECNQTQKTRAKAQLNPPQTRSHNGRTNPLAFTGRSNCMLAGCSGQKLGSCL
eukprot:13253554-Alexandrium_andersonii.AAC.1